MDQGEGGWQVSIFPQVETGSTLSAQQLGIGSPGPRLLLPVEEIFGLVAEWAPPAQKRRGQLPDEPASTASPELFLAAESSTICSSTDKYRT